MLKQKSQGLWTSASTLHQSSVFSPHEGGLRRETRQDLVRTRTLVRGGAVGGNLCWGDSGEAKGEKKGGKNIGVMW